MQLGSRFPLGTVEFAWPLTIVQTMCSSLMFLQAYGSSDVTNDHLYFTIHMLLKLMIFYNFLGWMYAVACLRGEQEVRKPWWAPPCLSMVFVKMAKRNRQSRVVSLKLEPWVPIRTDLRNSATALACSPSVTCFKSSRWLLWAMRYELLLYSLLHRLWTPTRCFLLIYFL